ncbi:MAG: lytic transglycosylase domain-containing protein [Endomicrobiaceae bacterium]|nr:lytic transglycosylase domain-containing protein [Endomicrobiaceae bacterium]
MKIFKIVLGLCLASLFIMFGYVIFNVNKALKFYPIIEQYSMEYNVDPLLITAVMKVESNFNPDAKSKKGAIGLMQLMPSTAKEIAEKYLNISPFKEEKLYDPEFNVKIGIYYVKLLSEMFNNNTNLVLASYNAGLGNVQKWHLENPIIEYDSQEMPFKETKNYVLKINKIYSILKYFKK